MRVNLLAMNDIMFVAVTVGFFIFSAFYVRWCDGL